ncbi:uncharacterized protein BJ212DRAFT_1301825 [Suillus subaureus]|uniref:C2H2-type domain-containing protein n=1 Tax=Suillus subaureus TaxID=48587 RepID=A0A9P7JAU7_9AGAM|nr:uncharacterized protein BJ212DRAFT_1301825 [Suillus subaureus]KAG1811802.1 hypothetical protein BJ212DRAFT_1301825 [Suillus subaureus]
MSKFYVCSAGCNQTFARFPDMKKHEATHSAKGYLCTWPGCDFATMLKASYDIHSAKHAGEQRHICPHDGCDFKTHNPSLLTCHRKKKHGYVPLPRGRGATSATESQPPAQPLLSGTSYQYQPPPIHNQSLGVLYGSADTADEYTMYTGPARAQNGWTEGCMCPELMQRRPSEFPGYDYRRQ